MSLPSTTNPDLWITWTDQEEFTGTPFPGMGPQLYAEVVSNISAEYYALGTLGANSVPTYADTPATVNAVDPFGGWTSQQGYASLPAVPGLTYQ